jgi:hypothetical protein
MSKKRINRLRINNKKELIEVRTMAETTESTATSTVEENGSIVIDAPNLEAKIILDWDDGQWYISDIQAAGGLGGDVDQTVAATSDSGGVKLSTWDSGYKYSEKDIVAYDGSLYVSNQNVNQGNTPDNGTFWWGAVVDLSSVDAITLEGRNLQEISRDILGGNTITDYYKKSEVDNIILTYFNNVNAKKLGDRTLDEIRDDFDTKISEAEQRAKDYGVDYLNNEASSSFQQMLIDTFNESILPDDINQL